MVNSKLFINQWRSELSSRDLPGHQLAFTKSAQEPIVGTKTRCYRAGPFIFSGSYNYGAADKVTGAKSVQWDDA